MQRRAVIAVIAAAMLFGTTGTARSLGPSATSVWLVGTLRIALGAITLLACALISRERSAAVGAKAARYIALGGVGAAIYQPAFFAGVEECGVAIGTVIALGSGPMFAGGIDRAIRQRPLQLHWFIGTAVMLIGVAVLVMTGSGGSDDAQLTISGVSFALAAGLGYAMYAQTTSSLIELKLSSTIALAAQFGVAAIILAPFMIIKVLAGSEMAWMWSASGAVMLLHLGVLTAGVAYMLYGWGLRVLPVSTAVSITLVEPLTAAGAAFVVLGERLSASGLISGVVVLIGLVVLTFERQPSPQAPQEKR